MKSIVLSILSLLAISEAYFSYSNYKVYNVVPRSNEQVQLLVDLKKQEYDFWTDVFDVGSDVRIMVSPDQDAEFAHYIESVGFNVSVAISNVQE